MLQFKIKKRSISQTRSAAQYVTTADHDIKAIVFDVDGVLVDSLSAHLRMCRDLVEKFSLDIVVPSEEEFRQIVQSGASISPMRDFFMTIGFPPNIADLSLEIKKKKLLLKDRMAEIIKDYKQ